MRMRPLHSRDASKRYRASLAFAKRYPDVSEVWPRGCYGAANAWLLLVGPSPGKAGPKEVPRLGGNNRPINKDVCIGPGVGVIDFKLEEIGTRGGTTWLPRLSAVKNMLTLSQQLPILTGGTFLTRTKSKRITCELDVLSFSVS